MPLGRKEAQLTLANDDVGQRKKAQLTLAVNDDVDKGRKPS